jgi:hypothetical protein
VAGVTPRFMRKIPMPRFARKIPNPNVQNPKRIQKTKTGKARAAKKPARSASVFLEFGH